MILDIYTHDFETYKNTRKLVIQFWASWCGPCMMLKPIVESLAAKKVFEDVQFVRVNVDEVPELSSAFQIQSIPALYFMSEGEIIDAKIGFRSEHVLEREIMEVLAHVSL